MDFIQSIKISKHELLYNKLNNKQYFDVGNFVKSINKCGISYEEYLLTYHRDKLPICLELRIPIANSVKGYWDKFHNIENKSLRRKAYCLNNKINKHIGFSKYITYEYWITNENKKISEAIDIIKKLIYRKKILSRLLEIEQPERDKYIHDILCDNRVIIFGKNTTEGWRQRGKDVNESIRLKNENNSSLKSKNNVSCFEKRFWMNKGYTESEAIDKISKIQIANATKRYEKYSTEDIRKQMVLCNEYWINKGYSETEAINKIKERQKTFSLDICVSNYGPQLGLEIFNKRQEKWQSSLNSHPNIYQINKSKGKSFSDWINKHGELTGRILFAKRYWKVDISSIEEFESYELFINNEYTVKFKNKEFRKSILENQDFRCGSPDCKIKNTEKIFHLHHIDYNKSNDERSNLIFLCNSCHSKTTNCIDRSFWIDFYSKINLIHL